MTGDRNSKRVKLTGSPGPLQRFLGTPVTQQPERDSPMGKSIIRVQFEGPSEFSLRVGPLPISLQRTSEQNMGLSQLRIELQRFAGGIDYLWAHFAGRSADENRSHLVVGLRQSDVCRCKGRVFADRILIVGNACFGPGTGVTCRIDLIP